jgi:hypothetical protein
VSGPVGLALRRAKGTCGADDVGVSVVGASATRRPVNNQVGTAREHAHESMCLPGFGGG